MKVFLFLCTLCVFVSGLSSEGNTALEPSGSLFPPSKFDPNSTTTAPTTTTTTAPTNTTTTAPTTTTTPVPTNTTTTAPTTTTPVPTNTTTTAPTTTTPAPTNTTTTAPTTTTPVPTNTTTTAPTTTTPAPTNTTTTAPTTTTPVPTNTTTTAPTTTTPAPTNTTTTAPTTTTTTAPTTTTPAPTNTTTTAPTTTTTTAPTTTTPAPTTTTTTAPTTTTPATTTTKPEPTKGANLTQGTYTLPEGKGLCLRAQLALEFRLVTDKVNGTFIVQPSMTKATGGCKASTANLTLSFKEGFITLLFNKSQDDKMVYVDTVSFSLSYPFTSGGNQDYSQTNSSLHLFAAAKGHSYSCKSESLYMGNGLYLDVTKDQMQAFNLINNQDFGKPQVCAADKPDYRVAIAVGVVLLVLIIIVLIAYLLGRRKRTSGYQSL